MKLRASFFLLAAATLTALLGAATAGANDAELNTLTFEAEALKQEFNAAGSLSRMVMILSPT